MVVMRAVLFRIGVAFALSVAGYLRFRPRPRPPSPKRLGGVAGLKEEVRVTSNLEALARIMNSSCSPTTATTTTSTNLTDLSPSSKSSGDADGFLLPEFSQLLLTEFEEPKQVPETTRLHIEERFEEYRHEHESTRLDVKERFDESKQEIECTRLDIEERYVMEEEINYLRNLVDALRERERTLEIQLLTYYGLREQESAVKELENQMKISRTGAKLLSLKVESLRAENDRLQAQVSDYKRAAVELESVRAHIRELQWKLRLDGEQAEEKIAELQQKLVVLQDRASEHEKDDAEIEENMKKLKEMENEVMNLRTVKSKLTQENSELKLKLRTIQTPTPCGDKGPKAEVLEESILLREENAKLKNNIEQLYIDRCIDVEELVYLRWINACLRYELRNYQPIQGKTVARDLSKGLSPESERKAKQLIVEYADLGADERTTSFLLDFDSDCCSSQASNEEPSDISIDVGSSVKTSSSRRSKFMSKLKKLVLRKDRNQKASSVDKAAESYNSERRGSVSPCSYDDTIGGRSRDSLSSFSGELALPNRSTEFESHVKSSRPPRSLEMHRLRRSNLEEAKIVNGDRCKSDAGMTYGYSRLLSGDPSDLSPNSLLDHFDIDDPELLELRKLAEALRISRGLPKMNKKRAMSFSFSSN